MSKGVQMNVVDEYQVRECRKCTSMVANDLKYGRAANVRDATICSECSLCSHIYMLPPPNGRESIGVCKLCGMTKTHFNSMNERGQKWGAWQGKEYEQAILERKGMERK